MINLIGGLFADQEQANQAYEVLQRSGFAQEKVRMFVRRPRRRTERATDVRVQDIGRYALLGAVIAAILGGAIGLLAGGGILPGTIPHSPLVIMGYVVGGLTVGVLIGAILGAASRLLRSQEKAEVVTRQIEKRGVLLTVEADNPEHEAKARRVMEEHRALEVGNPREKWDPHVWVSPNENHPSLADMR